MKLKISGISMSQKCFRFKILCDSSIQTDVIEAQRPDLVVVDKQRKSC